jgi:hypothetical protein
MLCIYDAATMDAALASDIDPELHSLLSTRKAALLTPMGDLTDDTVFLIIEAGDTEAAIIDHLGQSPLVEPMDGIRFPGDGFRPHWAWFQYHRGWYEMILTYGSTFANVLLIQDVPGVVPELLAMCRHYSGDGA